MTEKFELEHEEVAVKIDRKICSECGSMMRHCHLCNEYYCESDGCYRADPYHREACADRFRGE